MTGLSAASGAAGSSITITGQNFSGAAGNLSVFFGSSPASSVTVLSDALVTATVPAGSGTVDVTVQSGVNETDNISGNPNANVNAPIFGYGTSATSPADQFTFLNKTGTTTVVTSSVNPAVSGQLITLSATVTANGPGSGTPKGTVIFRSNGIFLSSATLNASGVASCKTFFYTGSHTIVAIYQGGANFTTSTSAGYVEVVNKDASAPKVTSSLNPSSSGQKVIFSVIVSPAAPGGGIPTGHVRFMLGSSLLGVRALTGGKATFAISTLPVGSDQVTVQYMGDMNFTPSSATIVQTVNRAGAVERLLAAYLDSPPDKKDLDWLFAGW